MVEYSTILIIEIGFGKNMLTNLKKNIEAKIYPHSSLVSGNLSSLNKGRVWGGGEFSGGTPCKILVFPFSEGN